MFSYPGITNITLPGGLEVSVFFLLVVVGGLVSFVYLNLRGPRVGVPLHEVWAGSAYGLNFSFIGAHLVSIVYYMPHKLDMHGPLLLLDVWHGLSSVGGFIGGTAGLAVCFRQRGRPVAVQALVLAGPVLASLFTMVSHLGGKIALAASIALLLWYYRKGRKRWLVHLELGVQALVLGWVFGRLACTLIYDHPGARTDFSLGFMFLDGHVRHNLGFYEAIYTAVVLVPALFYHLHRGVRVGVSMAWLVALYCPARFLSDFLRAWDLKTSEPRLWGMTPAQYGCILLLAASLWLISRLKKMPAADPPQEPPRES